MNLRREYYLSGFRVDRRIAHLRRAGGGGNRINGFTGNSTGDGGREWFTALVGEFPPRWTLDYFRGVDRVGDDLLSPGVDHAGRGETVDRPPVESAFSGKAIESTRINSRS